MTARGMGGRLGSTLVALAAFSFGLMAVESMARLWWQGAPRLEVELIAWLVSDRFATGPGSVFAEQATAYKDERLWLTVHTVCAGAALALSPLQFAGRLRRARPRLHRAVGRTWVGLVAVGTVASIGFLLAREPLDSYSGPAFGSALWALAILTAAALIAALRAVRRGAIASHRYWMLVCFGALMVAPMLRVGWVGVGGLLHVEMDQANLAWHAVLVPTIALAVTAAALRPPTAVARRAPTLSIGPVVGCALTATVALLVVLPGSAAPSAEDLMGEVIAAVLVLAAAVSSAAAVIAAQAALRTSHGGALGRLAAAAGACGVCCTALSGLLIDDVGVSLLTFNGPVLAAYLAFTLLAARRATRHDDASARHAWIAHTACMSAAPLLFAPLWLLLLPLAALPTVTPPDVLDVTSIALLSACALGALIALRPSSASGPVSNCRHVTVVQPGSLTRT